MTLEELVADLERRRADATRLHATAPVAVVYEVVIEDLRQLDGTPTAERLMDTEEAGRVLGVNPRTVARWCKRKRLEGARKTSDDEGKWLIPASSVYRMVGAKRTTRPKLWEAPE